MEIAAARSEREVTERATDVAHAWLRRSIYRELEAHAVRKRVHPDFLAAQIITAVLVLGDVDELIDRAVASLPD